MCNERLVMRKYIRENNAAPASDDTAAIKQFAKAIGITTTTNIDALASGLKELSNFLNDKPQFKSNFIKAFQDNNFKQLATAVAKDVKAQQSQQSTSAGTQAATATGPNEARRRTAAFVRYLFE